MVLIALPAAAPAPVAVEPAKVSLRADAGSGPQPHAPSTAPSAPVEFSAEVDDLLMQGAVSDTSQGLDSTVAPDGTAAPAEVAVGSPGSTLFLWSVVSATGVVAVLLGGLAWWNYGGDEAAGPLAKAEPAAEVDRVDESPQAANDTEMPTEELLPPAGQENPPQELEVQKPPVEEAPVPVPELPPPSAADRDAPLDDSSTEEPTAEPNGDSGEPETDESLPDEPPPMPQLIDPLGINPADLDLLLVPKSPTAQVPPQVASDGPEEEQPVEAPPQADLLDAPAQAKRFEPGSARLSPSFTEQFAPGAFEMRLAMRIPSIRWANAPLNRVLGELGQLSGIPIQIDPQTLRMAPVRATHRVTLSQQDASLDAILAQLAKSMRLEVMRVDDLLLLQKPDADIERQISYPVADLATGDAAVKELVQLIDMFALDEPSGATVSADSSQIVISRPASQQYEVLLFLERLRKSRSLPGRSKYPTELISVEPVLLALRERLSRPTTFAIVDWTPLSDVFDYWQDSSNLALIVDWRELASIDLRPLSTVAASADQVPWGDALDACLAPLDLGWIPVDGESLQLTTAAAAATYRWVEFYEASKLGHLTVRQQSADGLREALAERCDAQSMAQAMLADDPAGKQIIVRANREVHEAILALSSESQVAARAQ